ncbi:MAG: ferredoxin--NADP reductase [Bacteroidota bacterium]
MSIRFHSLAIDEIRDETSDAYSVFFQRPELVDFDYKPGQYLTLKVLYQGELLRRAFSLSSSPASDDRLSVTIKRVEGGRISNHIRDELKAGDALELLPPMGNFYVDIDPTHALHYILIGAGSGITPLMSILKTVLEGEPLSKVSLWYGNRDQDSIIFHQQLKDLQTQYHGRLEVYHTLSRPADGWEGATGRLDEERVYQLVSDLFMTDEYRKQYFVCGPDGLMSAAQKALEKHAVNPSDVHREYYSAPLPKPEELEAKAEDPVEGKLFRDGDKVYTVESQEVTITLNGEQTQVAVGPEDYILDAALDAKLDPPFACQVGICTTCRAYLHAGEVAMDESEGLSETEINDGFILTCKAHPLTPGVEIEFK